MKKKILIIGCGNIGFNHFKALKRFGSKIPEADQRLCSGASYDNTMLDTGVLIGRKAAIHA